jgi:hypothetical protein
MTIRSEARANCLASRFAPGPVSRVVFQVPGKQTFRLASYESVALRARRGTDAGRRDVALFVGRQQQLYPPKEKPISVGPVADSLSDWCGTPVPM